jgi:signal transduction histidine kinase
VALERVLLNLAVNALRFTDSGFVELAATTTVGRRVALAVRDTGPGMSAEVLAKLFEPSAGPRDRRSHLASDSGLGLTICRTLVNRMGSELQVESNPAGGTRMLFEVELPEAHLEHRT